MTHSTQAPVVVVAGVSDLNGSTFVRDLYTSAIVRAGGLPLIVPSLVRNHGLTERVLDRADAVLVPGGRDIDTRRLGLGPLHPEARVAPAEQQDADVALVHAALARDLPILGICWGMQLLGAVGGGAVHQHLPDDAPSDVRHFHDVHEGLVEHGVNLVAGSRVAAAYEPAVDGHFVVPSGHHQALASTGPDWFVTARADDGIIEAIESRKHRFAVGVQWHPERAQPVGSQDGIFRALVEAAAA